MKKMFNYSMLCGALLALSQLSVSADDKDKPAGGFGRVDEVLVSVTASVQSVDAKTREVTLKGPLGNTVTFTVDRRVKRFNEIKVGDYVTAEYYISVAGEVREPTAEEKEHPLVVLEGAAKAPPGTSPAAGGLRRFKVVTTIEGLDRPTQTVTVKGPLGNYVTARVADPSRLTEVRIGQTIVVTYTEALAVSLEKTSKKKEA